jgi:hypothetical protein
MKHGGMALKTLLKMLKICFVIEKMMETLLCLSCIDFSMFWRAPQRSLKVKQSQLNLTYLHQ